MFDKSDIRAAVEGGVLSDEAAKRFEAFLKGKDDSERGLSSENLRFLANFNDVFLTIGIAILMTGLAVLSGLAMWNIFGIEALMGNGPPTDAAVGTAKLAAVLTPVPVMVGAWLLAEYFCGRRRLLLPSMALSLIIVVSTAVFIGALIAPSNQSGVFSIFNNGGGDLLTGAGYLGFGAGAVAALAIFMRFRLPFSLFLLALSMAGLFYTSVARINNGDMLFSGVAMLIVGLVTLGAAIWFDARDPQRISRTSDHAFWLHMAAAPQIIFGVRGLVLGSGFAPAGAADATVMLIVLLVFAVISLMLNRRALIVSGLISFATALAVLVDSVGGGGVNTLMLTALLVGGAIVLLGGGWRTARRFILKAVPSGGLVGRIFPPEPA
jgi:hypothetical protein